MELIEGLLTRKVTRAFLDKPVAMEKIREVLDIARHAPSGSNMQPWELFMSCGEERNELVRLLNEAYGKDGRSYSANFSGKVPKKYTKRTESLLKSMKPFLEEAGYDSGHILKGSLSFFNAPAIIFAYIHRSLSPSRLACIGSFMAYFSLAAHAKGLGSCPIGYVRGAEDVIRDFYRIPEDLEFVVAFALGYRDASDPLNSFASSRVPLDELFTAR